MPNPTFVYREEWQAAAFRGKVHSLGSPELIVVHHTAGFRAATLKDGKRQVREIQRLHQGPPRNWADIGYHFLIDASGNVYQGRPFFRGSRIEDVPRFAMGAHVLNQNSKTIGVCLLGCFHPVNQDCKDKPSPAAISSLRQILAFLMEMYGVSPANIKTHRDFMSTDCPGDTLFRIVSNLRDELVDGDAYLRAPH